MSPKQRLVIDTNVLISAALKPHSLPKAAVKAAALNHCVLVSDRTYAELEGGSAQKVMLLRIIV
jgi:predicted nucleic acid-binding protein